MFQEQSLVDIARAIGLIRSNQSGNGYELVETWIEQPLVWTDAALQRPENRALLLGGLEELLEHREGQPYLLGDGIATIAIPETPLQLLLRNDGTNIQLGVGVAYRDPNGRLELSFRVYLLTYSPGSAIPFTVFARLDLEASLLLVPVAGGPFQRGLLQLQYADKPGLNNARLRVYGCLVGLSGSDPAPREAEFVLDPISNPQGWEAQLLQIALTGGQVALAHLLAANGPSAAIKKVGQTLFDHLLPLFGLAPADVPGVAAGLQLPALPLDALLKRPTPAFQGWLSTLFSNPTTRDRSARAFLFHLAELLTLGEAGPVAALASGPTCTNGQPCWLAPLLGTADALPVPRLLLWVEPDTQAGLRLCLGLQLAHSSPAMGAAPALSTAPYFHALPSLELTFEALTIPLSGSFPVRAAKHLELRVALSPANGSFILERIQGPRPGDSLIEHLGGFAGGLRLVDGHQLQPFLELTDLQIGGQAKWEKVDLLSTAALVEVGASAAVEALTDSLVMWLGTGIGDSLVRLIGLRRPVNAPTWPLVVPAPVNGVTVPGAADKIRRLLTDLPGVYAEWLYLLLDGSGNSRPLVAWLDELKTLLDALYDTEGPLAARRGTGTPSDPWCVSLLPPGAGNPFDLSLELRTSVSTVGARRQLSSVLVLDLLKEQLQQTWLTSGAKLRLLDITLEPDAQGIPRATQSKALSEAHTGIRLDSNLVIVPPSLNPQGTGSRIRAELGEAEAALGWARGSGSAFWLQATSARIPAPSGQGPDVLTGPSFRLMNLRPDGEPGELPVHLLLGAFALDQAGQEQNEAGYKRMADGMLGLGRFMGWVPQSLLPGAWKGFAPAAGPDFSPGLHTIPALETYFQSEGLGGLLTLLTRRLCNPTEDVAGVGVQEVLDHFAAWVNGKVALELLAAPYSHQDALSRFRTGAGTAEDPFFVTLLRNRQGLPVLELVIWRVLSGTTLTHFGVGVRSVLVDTTTAQSAANSVAVEGSLRIDLIELARQPAAPANRVRMLPMNLRYECNIGRKDGSALWSDGAVGTPARSEVGTLRLRLGWREDTGVETVLSLTDALCQGQGPTGPTKGTIPLHSALAAPLLSGIQGMSDSPFKSGKGSVKAMLNVLAALGLVTLDAGGASGFLAAPVAGLAADPGAYLQTQFTDPHTGILRLGTLVQALEGDPNSTSGLLQLLNLKRLPGESGFDLAVQPDGTLRFTAVDRQGTLDVTWLDVRFNPLTRAFAYDVQYPPGADPAGVFSHFSNAQTGSARPFALWAEADLPIVRALLGKSRLELAPPDWPTIFRLLGIVAGAVGSVIGLWFFLKKVAEPRMKTADPATVDFFVAAGWLRTGTSGLRIPGLFELIKEGAGLPDKLLAQTTIAKLDTALGTKRFFRNAFQLAMVTTAQRTDLSLGTTLAPAPNPAPAGDWPFGRTKLGKGFGLELLLRAGAAFAGNSLNTGAFQGQVVLGTHALWGSQSFGIKGAMDFAGALSLDLVLRGAGAASDTAFPLYPSFGMTGLAQFLGIGGQGGRTLMVLGLEALVKCFDTYLADNPAILNKHPRNLIAHFLGGMGVLTRGADGKPDMARLEQGEVTIDQARFAQLLPASATGPYPQALLNQMDASWLTEALMDLANMFRLPVATSPSGSSSHILWKLLEKTAEPKLALSLVAGNYLNTHPGQGNTGVGLRFHLQQPDSQGRELFEIGWADEPVIWAWLKNESGQFKILLEMLMRAVATIPLPTSQHLIREEVFGGAKLEGGTFEPRLSLRMLSGRREPLPAPNQTKSALAARGIRLDIFPTFKLEGASYLDFSPPGQPAGITQPIGTLLTAPTAGKVDGIVSLAASFIADLVLFEASDGRARILDLDLPFITPSLGQVLGGVRDRGRNEQNRKRWFDATGAWASPIHPAYINYKNVLPDLLEALKGGSGAPAVLKSVSLAVDEQNSLYGIQLKRTKSARILPFVSLVMGQEDQLDEEYPLKLWLMQLRSPILGDPDWKVAFKPGVSMRDLGIKITGREGRPLLDRGKVQLASLMVAGSLNYGQSDAANSSYAGIKLVVDRLSLPLGQAKGDTPANRMLAADGSNPGLSGWASYEYEADNEPLRLGFTGGSEDASGMHWFPVAGRTGEADLGRIGVSYKQNRNNAAEGRLNVGVDGRFGLGPLKVEVDDFGVDFALKNLFRPREWNIELAGMGISYTSPAVSLLGGLRHTTNPEGYVGAAIVNLKALELSALGAWSKIPVSPGATQTLNSLFVFARVSANPGLGGPPFFFVKGIAGGFGYNRSFVLPTQPAQISNHALIKAMNPTANTTAMQLIEQIQIQLPPKQNAYWLALGVDFTSFKFIRAQALLYMAIDQGFTIGLLGLAQMKLPEAKPIVNLELAFDASFSTTDNDPRMRVMGSLTANSWVFIESMRLSGDFALCAWFKRRDAMLSLGGYHRDFVVPDHYPKNLARVRMEFRPSDKLSIGGEMYFAITPRELMGGQRMYASYEGKTIVAHFETHFDVRIGWDPFFYDLQWGIEIRGGLRNWPQITLSANLHVWGPPFGGQAAVKICGFWVTFAFGKPKDAVQLYLLLDTTVRRHILQRGATDPIADTALWTTTPWGRVFKESSKLVVLDGRRPEPVQSTGSAPPETPITELKLQPEFGLELRLNAPATEVRLSGSPGILPVTVPSPTGSSVRTTAFDPVDLVMSRDGQDQRFPLLIRLRQASTNTAVPLTDTSLFEIKATAGYFPSAVYSNAPMITVTTTSGETRQVPDFSRQPMTLPMIDSLSMRFKKRRGEGGTFVVKPVTGQSGLPLAEVNPVSSNPRAASLKMAQDRSDESTAAQQAAAQGPAPLPLQLKVAQASKTPTAPSTASAIQTASAAASRRMNAGAATLRTAFELVAGGMVQVNAENLQRGSTASLRLTITGDQAVRVACVNRSGLVVSHLELAPGAAPLTLPQGVASVTLLGLGRPPINGPDGKPLARPASPGFADFSRLTGTGEPAALGANPEDRLIHLGRGLHLARGSHLQILSTLAAPPELGYRGAGEVLLPVRAFQVAFPAFTGTALLHLRPGVEQPALVDPTKAADRVARATTGTIRRFMGAGVVVCGSELGVLYDVDAPGNWNLLWDLKGSETVAGFSLLPGAPASWVEELSKGRGWTGVEDGPLSREGRSSVVLEVV